MRTIVGLVAAVLWVYASSSAGQASDAQSDIARLLTQSANAWNHGDLDTFMHTYEDSPQTVYIGAKTIVHGYAAIRARYAGHYKPGRMGTLGVSDLVVRKLGSEYAVATARWHLERPADKGGTVSGLFSLVLHHNRTGWRIIADHTP